MAKYMFFCPPAPLKKKTYTLHLTLNYQKKKKKSYLGIKAHCILGGFVEFGVFQHVFFPTRSLKYPQSERRQSSKDLRKQTQRYISCEIDSFFLGSHKYSDFHQIENTHMSTFY